MSNPPRSIADLLDALASSNQELTGLEQICHEKDKFRGRHLDLDVDARCWIPIPAELTLEYRCRVILWILQERYPGRGVKLEESEWKEVETRYPKILTHFEQMQSESSFEIFRRMSAFLYIFLCNRPMFNLVGQLALLDYIYQWKTDGNFILERPQAVDKGVLLDQCELSFNLPESLVNNHGSLSKTKV